MSAPLPDATSALGAEAPPPKTPPWVVAAAASLGLLGVAAGAFGAHALRGSVSPSDLEIWKTAAHYQQVHAAVLLGVAALGRDGFTKSLRLAAIAFVVGILIFSGTLDAIVLGGPRILGAVTPLGGLSLMAGWAALIAHGLPPGRAEPRAARRRSTTQDASSRHR